MRIVLTEVDKLFTGSFKKAVGATADMSEELVDRFMKAIVELKAEYEADRQKHYGFLIGLWQAAVANVDLFADEALEHPLIKADDEILRVILAPYELMNNIFAGKLVGTLNHAEEYEFAKTSELLGEAWGKLFGVFRLRARSPEKLIAAVEAAVKRLNARLTGIYRGVEKPVADDVWVTDFGAAKAGLGELMEGLAK